MNPLFYKIVLDQVILILINIQPVYLDDIESIDRDLGKTLKEF